MELTQGFPLSTRDPTHLRHAFDKLAKQLLVEHEDFTLFADLLRVLSRASEDQEGFEAYATAPRASERVLQTFCGT
jgi:uncharacterized protein YdiU (UPF0061 family)